MKKMCISEKSFGRINGIEIPLITISEEKGFSVSFSPFAAAIVSIMTKDKDGKFADVIQGGRHHQVIGKFLCVFFTGAELAHQTYHGLVGFKTGWQALAQ